MFSFVSAYFRSDVSLTPTTAISKRSIEGLTREVPSLQGTGGGSGEQDQGTGGENEGQDHDAEGGL